LVAYFVGLKKVLDKANFDLANKMDLFRNKLATELIFSDLNVVEEVQRAREDTISLSKRNV
jgi:predicted oxidoreductase (fatty acid repression mutant protein)